MDWISVKDRLPEQHDSIFAKLKGTAKWNEHMWEKSSDRVLIVAENKRHDRAVDTGFLRDRKWKLDFAHLLDVTVIYWAPLPEPPED